MVILSGCLGVNTHYIAARRAALAAEQDRTTTDSVPIVQGPIAVPALGPLCRALVAALAVTPVGMTRYAAFFSVLRGGIQRSAHLLLILLIVFVIGLGNALADRPGSARGGSSRSASPRPRRSCRWRWPARRRA